MFRSRRSCYLPWEPRDLKLIEFNGFSCPSYPQRRASFEEYLNSAGWRRTCKKFSCSISISRSTDCVARSTSSDAVIFTDCTMSRTCKVSSQPWSLVEIALPLTKEARVFVSSICRSLKASVSVREDGGCQNLMLFITQYPRKSRWLMVFERKGGGKTV